MIGQLLMTLFLVGMVAETAREAYGVSVNWKTRHFTRMMPFTKLPKPPRDFWTEPPSRRERWVHRRRWHIDLNARTGIKKLKK